MERIIYNWHIETERKQKGGKGKEKGLTGHYPVLWRWQYSVDLNPK